MRVGCVRCVLRVVWWLRFVVRCVVFVVCGVTVDRFLGFDDCCVLFAG